MVNRWSLLTALGVLLSLTTGCPEPGDEAGEGLGGTAETGETGSDGDSSGDGDGDADDSGGVEGDGNLRPPLDTGDGDGDGDGDNEFESADDPGRCWDRTWNGDELPALIIDNTIGRSDDFLGSCGIGAAPDFQLGFVAPWAGSFTFDTSGSSFDTVLYVNDGECGTPELACNDDFIDLESRLTIDLELGQIVTVNVDGAGAFEEGPFKLNITEAVPPVCEPDMIVPNLPAQLIGDTSNDSNQLASGCGGAQAPEHVYEFVAPGPGSYRFDTMGSEIDTVLYLLDECAGAPLVCDNDVNLELYSELVAELAGGQHVLVVVDGHDADAVGPFVLNVHKL